MPAYTLAQAAEATGLNRSTILRAIKSGKISGARDSQGAWSVEPVELHRAFAPAEATPKAVPQHAQADTRADALVAELRTMLADVRADRDRIREDLERWRLVAERLSLPSPPKTFWQWLRAK
jgi:excisionase family DNA binding protein